MIASATYKVQDVINFLHSKGRFYAAKILRSKFHSDDRVTARNLQEWWQAYFPGGLERESMWREMESAVVAQLQLKKI